MKLKSKKSALLLSFTSLLLCFAMLVGSTFAWFTDTASTGVNKIKAGNLDIEVQYRTTADGEWKPLDNATDLFGTENTRFEPGHTRVVELKIENAGNLALKYKIGMNIASETLGTNKFGKSYKLSDSLKVATSPIQQYDPNAGPHDISYAMEQQIFASESFLVWKHRDFANFELDKKEQNHVLDLQPGDAQILGIKVYMPDSVGNEANALTTEEAASITFGLNILATQYTYERDSFSNTYDKDALYPDVTVIKAEGGKTANENAEEVLSANEKVINVALAEDVTLDVEPYDHKPMGGEATEMITIDAQGHKLTFNNRNNDWTNVTWGNAKLVIKNAKIDNDGYHADGGPWNNHNIYFKGNVELENVTFTNAVALEGTAVLKNVSISDVNATQDVYMLWICAGSNVTLENVNINGQSEVGKSNRAIAIKDEYITDPAETTLTINGATITSDKYAAVYVTSKSATTVNLKGVIDVTGTAVPGQIVQKSDDSTGAVTVND